MNKDQSGFVERFGRYYEEMGGARTAGRMLGWLMICDPPERTAADLVDDLGVSTGSVSTVTRALASVGLVERITFPGERSSYYRLREHAWLEAMNARMTGIKELRHMALAARTLVGNDRQDRVEDLVTVTDFFLERWPRLMDDLHEVVAQRTGAHHE